MDRAFPKFKTPDWVSSALLVKVEVVDEEQLNSGGSGGDDSIISIADPHSNFNLHNPSNRKNTSGRSRRLNKCSNNQEEEEKMQSAQYK